MPENSGTLPVVIASHVRFLAQKVQKEGVWEDTQMLNSAFRGVRGSGARAGRC